jgi:hypothetical protein
MALRLIPWIFDRALGFALGTLLLAYISGGSARQPFVYQPGAKSYAICSVALLCFFVKLRGLVWKGRTSGKEKESMYGLEHGKLHLQVPTPMWMNMGYWRHDSGTQTLAEACKDLLKMVLREAGFERGDGRAGPAEGTRRKKMLIDVGFGCGEQTMYLMSDAPLRPSDREWWDEREHCETFDHYIGITNNAAQHRYASKRVEELLSRNKGSKTASNISLFCADAAKPASWDDRIKQSIDQTFEGNPERWIMALDTAYHFSPTRWALVKYAYDIQASFMAFDLCLSPTATFTQKLILRILTTLMRAPWTNFVTPEEYQQKLVTLGYSASAIKVVDVSEHVFGPLAQYLEEQDARLKTMGLGIGAFGVAKTMFRWWGRSGVVRGVIVVARR